MPGTIAVVGASSDRAKFGNKCVRAYASAGWEVHPVNPREREIEGLPVHRTLAEVAAEVGEIDRVSVYLPPETTRGLLSELARTGAETFFNPGSANRQVLAEAAEAGIEVRDACSIVAIGLSPSQFPSSR